VLTFNVTFAFLLENRFIPERKVSECIIELENLAKMAFKGKK